MAPIISRFAPAPTGYLHLGHVANAVYVWGMTGARGGRVRLRIDDHDRLRSRPEYDAALLEDLAWLGFVPDGPPVRQSARGDIYVQALDALRRQGLVRVLATVDDDLQGVTLVIRGDDLLSSAGRQLQLARLLGCRKPPVFFHHALIMKSADQKLSKSDGDTGVRDLRAQGWSAARMIGRAAWLAGLMERETPLPADEAPRLFAYYPKP